MFKGMLIEGWTGGLFEPIYLANVHLYTRKKSIVGKKFVVMASFYYMYQNSLLTRTPVQNEFWYF